MTEERHDTTYGTSDVCICIRCYHDVIYNTILDLSSEISGEEFVTRRYYNFNTKVTWQATFLMTCQVILWNNGMHG